MIREMNPKQQGQGLTEYALLLSLIAVACIALLSLTGQKTANALCSVQSAFSGDDTCSVELCGDNFNENNDNWTSGWGNSSVQDGQMCMSNYDKLYDGCSSEIEQTDYVINLDGATLTEGNGYGVYFRTTYEEAAHPSLYKNNGYTFQYDPGYGGFTFEKWAEGKSTGRIAAVKMPNYDWYDQSRQIQVRVEGNTYTAYIDGEEVLSATDDTYTEGGAGLRAWGGTEVCFDDFSVEKNP